MTTASMTDKRLSTIITVCRELTTCFSVLTWDWFCETAPQAASFRQLAANWLIFWPDLVFKSTRLALL